MNVNLTVLVVKCVEGNDFADTAHCTRTLSRSIPNNINSPDSQNRKSQSCDQKRDFFYFLFLFCVTNGGRWPCYASCASFARIFFFPEHPKKKMKELWDEVVETAWKWTVRVAARGGLVHFGKKKKHLTFAFTASASVVIPGRRGSWLAVVFPTWQNPHTAYSAVLVAPRKLKDIGS